MPTAIQGEASLCYLVFLLDEIADAVAPRCKGPKPIIRVINFELVQPIWPRYINITDGQTDDLR